MPDLISIITPIFNGEKFISETIESVINQTYQEWEMIIIDNCSTDSSAEIIKLFQENNIRIKYIKLDQNSGGPARPRNIGIDNAKGEYIAFLDADDVWVDNKLEMQIKYMQDSKLNFTSTNSINIDSNSNNINKKYKIWSLFGKFKSKSNLCDIIKGNFIATSSVVVKKDSIFSFDENPDFISVEDMCLWMKILNNTNTRYQFISEKLLKYRMVFTSISERGVSHKQVTKGNLCIMKFILDNKRFDLVICFYIRIIRIIFINVVKRIICR